MPNEVVHKGTHSKFDTGDDTHKQIAAQSGCFADESTECAS